MLIATIKIVTDKINFEMYFIYSNLSKILSFQWAFIIKKIIKEFFLDIAFSNSEANFMLIAHLNSD